MFSALSQRLGQPVGRSISPKIIFDATIHCFFGLQRPCYVILARMFVNLLFIGLGAGEYDYCLHCHFSASVEFGSDSFQLTNFHHMISTASYIWLSFKHNAD